MRSDRLGDTLLPKRLALPIFASDALSSVAYAPDEVFIMLALAGASAYVWSWKIAIAVSVSSGVQNATSALPFINGHESTVATVKWTADQMMRRLLPQGHVPELVDPSGNVVIAEVTVNPAWVGHRISELEDVTGSRAAYLTRLGVAMLPAADSVFQEGDLLHLATLAAELASVERTLAGPPSVTDH